MAKGKTHKLVYGMYWNVVTPQLAIEMEMCRKGGTVKLKDGSVVGNGVLWHWLAAKKIIWPEYVHHRWNELETKCYIENKYIGEMGCAAGGKTETASTNILFDWYLYPHCTTCLISSTDLKSLDLRAWGQIKKYHRMAKERFPYLIPGHLIEGTRVIINDEREKCTEGRDFKNGLLAVPTKHGNTYVGLGPLIGIHNKRIRMLSDELNLCPRAFLDSTSNLSKCEDFKMVGIGQPADTTCAHGDLCEPHASLGGWESGIDQSDKTKTWRTKWPNGICIQLPGSDSPNFDVPEGKPPPYPFLITRQQMADDAEHWGVNDWHFTMMNLGRMPRGAGTNRVLTRQMCEKFHAFDEPIWRDTNIKKIAFLDAAYSVGGDRCIFGEMNFGRSAEMLVNEIATTALSSQTLPEYTSRQIIHLVDTAVVPITDDKGSDLPEDQIVHYVVNQCERRGISLDDFFYDPGMRTKLTVAFSRITGRTGNPIDCGGKATERPVAAGVDVLCVDYYSKFVTELWYSVRLCVEANQFRGMTKDAVWEFAAREWMKVGGNKIEIESKADMRKKTGRSPDCFVAGTMVATVDGPRAIESIQEGDLVTTPFGPSPVIAVQSDEVIETVRLKIENRVLEGKANHRIFTWDSGWVRMDSISIDNEIETINNLRVWESWNRLFTKETRTTFKALVDIIKTQSTVSLSGFYIEPSGRSTTAQFLMVLWSIIKMVIGETIILKIFNLKRLANTLLITLKSTTEKILNFLKGSKKRDRKPLKNGTPRKPEGNGMRPTLEPNGSIENPNNTDVNFAENHSTKNAFLGSPIVLTLVPKKLPEEGIGLRGVALCAVNALRRFVMMPPRTVPVSVRRIQLPSKRKVYNLTLAEHNVYYANGILVENCADAVAIGLEGARQRGFVIVKAGAMNRPRGQIGDRWKRELRDSSARAWRSRDLDYSV